MSPRSRSIRSSRPAGERHSVAVLVEPGRLADERELCVGIAFAEDDLRPAARERAAHAVRGLRSHRAEGRCALHRVQGLHSTAPPGRRRETA